MFFKKKSKKVKCVCNKCGEVDFFTRSELLKNNLLNFLLFLGIVFLFLIIFIGAQNMMASLTGGIMFKLAGYQSDFDARTYGLNKTVFDGRDSFIFAEELLANMPHIRYVPSSFFNPLPSYEEILSQGADCKGMSTLFTKIMQENGYPALIHCNIEHNHCVSKILYDGSDESMKDKYMIVDLTVDFLGIYSNDNDFWDLDKPYKAEYYIK